LRKFDDRRSVVDQASNFVVDFFVRDAKTVFSETHDCALELEWAYRLDKDIEVDLLAKGRSR